ncbi:MAG TPA: hypothetical protein VHO94_00980 [Oscillospiraceae bacterium]|nr:hypothetical protein [Oscillospiraceae bacterium]
MKKSTCFLLTALFFLLGIVTGFMFSPVKHGINIGNNSGNTHPRSDEINDCDCDMDY